jgi:hypothetical protein
MVSTTLQKTGTETIAFPEMFFHFIGSVSCGGGATGRSGGGGFRSEVWVPLLRELSVVM